MRRAEMIMKQKLQVISMIFVDCSWKYSMTQVIL